MFRNPNGKMLRNIFNHATLHDLSDVSPFEKGLIFLLMSIAGNSSSPDGKYGFNGAMQIHFPNATEAIDALRSRGYLVDPLPLDALLQEVTAPEIKELLKSHGLPVSGKRDVLVERLLPVLQPTEIAALHAKHDYWLPSDLGFEMIYSLYYLWECRQLALLDALAAKDIKAVESAGTCMPTDSGYWDDTPVPRNLSETTQKLIFDASSAGIAFQWVCGYRPEIFIHSELSPN